MTMTSANAEVRTVAQQWFARLLAPDCSDAERAACVRWRTVDPAHDAAYRQVENIWTRSAWMREDPAIATALREALRPAKRNRHSWSDRWPSLAAAAVILMAAVALWRFWPEATPVTRYATTLGEQRTIMLEDGSRVVLDTNTQLLVRFDRHQRDLTLEHGQADLTVKHDAAWPFVVQTAGGAVTDTGTRFQVRVQDDKSTVTLLEGSVEVAAQGSTQSTVLKAGERVTFDASGGVGTPQVISQAELASLNGWTQGNLVVKGWPLATVLTEMNRYSATKLYLGDPSLGRMDISGVFKAGDQKSFVLALEYGWGIHADPHSSNDEIILTRR